MGRDYIQKCVGNMMVNMSTLSLLIGYVLTNWNLFNFVLVKLSGILKSLFFVMPNRLLALKDLFGKIVTYRLSTYSIQSGLLLV